MSVKWWKEEMNIGLSFQTTQVLLSRMLCIFIQQYHCCHISAAQAMISGLQTNVLTSVSDFSVWKWPTVVCLSQSDVERHTLAKYLMELTLIDYNMVHYRPSEIAAAALCLSQLLLEGLPWVSCWTWSDWIHGCIFVSLVSNCSVSSQSATQQHYSTYDEAHLKPIMQHIAKNIVMVNEGRTKFQVRGLTKRTMTSDFWFEHKFKPFSSSAGCEEKVLEQQADEDQPHPSAAVVHRQEHGGCSAQQSLKLTNFHQRMFHLHFIFRSLWRNLTSF